MKGKFQWSLELEINAKPARVWEIIDDINLIPRYHPEVGKVNLISGQSKRAAGVKYRCNILEGRKGSCVEEVVEYIPNVKISTGMVEDTWGMDKIFADFIVETTIAPKDCDATTLKFEAFYNPVGIFYKILNAHIMRRMMKKRSLLVMKGIKKLSEE
jgi:uncharacterized protein YndB with AHSA1/START domain